VASDYISNTNELHALVQDYLDFEEFVFDVETTGDFRGDPRRNQVFWVSLAGPGRADVIPCGHPIGERVDYPADDTVRRINPSNHHHQERRINEATGREKWFDVEEPFSDPPKQLWVSEVMEGLQPLFFATNGRRVVGQNVKFDLESVAKYYDGAVPTGPYGDTLVASRLIDENFPSHRLGECVKRAFHFEYEKIGRIGPERFPFSEARLYSYYDAKYTWLLWQRYKRALVKENVRSVFDLEMELLPVIIHMESVGAPIDVEALERLREEFALQLARIQVAVNKRAGTEVNLNAGRQVAQLVYDTLGHTCNAWTASGERSVARETLESFSKDPVVKQLLEHAQLRKLQSTFVDGLLNSHIDGRIHSDFNQMGAVSGRLSSRSPNLQQIPSRSERGKKVRSVFKASEGYRLIVSDLSQIELRMLAHFTQDPRLLKAYRENLDLHAMTARVVYGDSFTDIQRTFAKSANFSVLYGAGPGTLVRRYGVQNMRVARQLLQAFYDTYEEVQPWKWRLIKQARSTYQRGRQVPYVATILGRKRRLPGLLWSDDDARSAAERQAVSVTISGSAADLFKVIMVNCYDALQVSEYGAKILMTVHDELVVEAPEKYAEEVLAIVKQSMENVKNPITGKAFLSVPIVADAKIVENWGDK